MNALVLSLSVVNTSAVYQSRGLMRVGLWWASLGPLEPRGHSGWVSGARVATAGLELPAQFPRWVRAQGTVWPPLFIATDQSNLYILFPGVFS